MKKVKDVKRCIEALEIATDYYQYMLNNNEGYDAMTYLKHKLGLSEDMIKRYRIGCAPSRYDFLRDDLMHHGFTEEELFEAGILVKDKHGEYIDRFTNGKIIIPMINHQGRVEGLTGLSFNGLEPKLSSTSMSDVYKRREMIYGLDKCLRIRDNYLILTNNIMNVFCLNDATYNNAVCPATLTLTEEQANTIKQYFGEVVIVADNDRAGLREAYSAQSKLRRVGIKTSVVEFAKSKCDEVYVEEFIHKYGREKLDRIIHEARTIGQVPYMPKGIKF